MQFLKEKFEIILMTILFVMLFLFWVHYDFNEKVFVFLNVVFGSLITLLRVIQKPNTINAEQISADNIETAKTQSGDIITTGKPIGGR